MCLALQQIEQKGRMEGRMEVRAENICLLIRTLRKFSLEEDVIRSEIMTQYDLTDEEARRFMQSADV